MFLVRGAAHSGAYFCTGTLSCARSGERVPCCTDARGSAACGVVVNPLLPSALCAVVRQAKPQLGEHSSSKRGITVGIFMTFTWVSALPQSPIPPGEPELKPEVLPADKRPGTSHAERVQLPPRSEQPCGDAHLELDAVQGTVESLFSLYDLCLPRTACCQLRLLCIPHRFSEESAQTDVSPSAQSTMMRSAELSEGSCLGLRVSPCHASSSHPSNPSPAPV